MHDGVHSPSTSVPFRIAYSTCVFIAPNPVGCDCERRFALVCRSVAL